MIPQDYENIFNSPEIMEELKSQTPARIGIGHCGPRCTTNAVLQFRAAHALANDAVQKELNSQIAQKMGVHEYQTLCSNKYDMITRPDWGRLFSEETQQKISEECLHDVDVEIFFGDGLSTPAVEQNVPIIYPLLRKKLLERGLTVGTPFFVRYCRVNTCRTIGPLLNAKITCVLIGERPGLITDESMSAYFAYQANPLMSECDYKVVSNISRVGTHPEQAADQIVGLMMQMYHR